MATTRKPGSNDDEHGKPQGGHLNSSVENGQSADSELDNPELRSMQAGQEEGKGGDAGEEGDSDSARDPDRDPQGSIEAIDEGDSTDGVLNADEAESLGNDDPSSRSADVRDNPRGVRTSRAASIE
ncbi:MAG: hypothetical protein H7X91_06155 [Burkholderiales bacterium]|nr:hypothetical protein [Burkholderiales bacterium]